MLAGIYLIRCETTGETYIGSSGSIFTRWGQHTHQLQENKHVNRYLQAAWNKYGATDFVFSILELVPSEAERFIIEKSYIAALKPSMNIMTNTPYTIELDDILDGWSREEVFAALERRSQKEAEQALQSMVKGHKAAQIS
jgi:group I intron endonuclease